MLSNQAMEREQQCVAEISLYPLCHDHVPVIREFIVSLERYKALSLSVSTTSTQVRGPYSFVFKVLGEEIYKVHQQVGQAILVCKFLMGDDIGLGLHLDHNDN